MTLTPEETVWRQQFQDLLRHAGHKIEIGKYGKNDVTWNVAIECMDCYEVIHSIDALPIDLPCDDCGADPGEECRFDCLSRPEREEK